MAILLRKDKGIPLTHNEADENFVSNFYRAELEDDGFSLYYTASSQPEWGPNPKQVKIPFQWVTQGVNLVRNGDPGTIVKIPGSIQTGEGTVTFLDKYSYAGGLGTIAEGSYQQVQGKYNKTSTDQGAFIVGNGSSPTNRSNLLLAAGNRVSISGSLDVSGSITGDGSKLDNIHALTKVFYVTEQGNDANDGKTLQSSFLTIKRACEAALAQYNVYILDEANSATGGKPYRLNINVKSGYYTEEAPIIVPPFTTINGNDLRSVVVKPTPETNGENLFLLDNSTYIYGLRLEGCVLDSLEDPREGFYFAFNPGAYLITSPYIQNCTAINTPFEKFYTPLSFEDRNSQVGNGPGGMMVDDSVLDPYSPLKSMIVDAYTQVAFNGIGICLRGRGYGQMVSFFTNFSRVGVYAMDGGHASLLNSNTTFGDYGLRASGSRILINPDISVVDPAIYYDPNDIPNSDAGKLALMKPAIQNYEIQYLKEYGNLDYQYLYQGTPATNALLASCSKDAGFLVDALVADLKSTNAANTSKFIQGYFKGQDRTTNKKYTLPSASNAYTRGAITVIPQKLGDSESSDDKKFTKDYLLTFNAIKEYIYTSSLSAPARIKVNQLINTLNYTLSSVVLQETGSYLKVVPDTSAVYTYTASLEEVGVLESKRQAIIDHEISELAFYPPNYARYVLNSTNAVVRAKCARDAGHLIDALKADLLTTGSAYTVRYVQGLFAPISSSAATRTLDSGLNTFIPQSSGVYNNIPADYVSSFGYINAYIQDPDNNIAISNDAKQKIEDLIDVVKSTVTDLVVNNLSTSPLIQEVPLLEEFGSLITSTSHDFSYAGSGVNYLAFPNNQGGTGKTSISRRIVNEAGGRVYHTSGDETGDFYAGDDFIIRQDTGTIDGRTFAKSLSALTIPINLSLEG